jgi:hypothetical protein
MPWIPYSDFPVYVSRPEAPSERETQAADVVTFFSGRWATIAAASRPVKFRVAPAGGFL